MKRRPLEEESRHRADRLVARIVTVAGLVVSLFIVGLEIWAHVGGDRYYAHCFWLALPCAGLLVLSAYVGLKFVCHRIPKQVPSRWAVEASFARVRLGPSILDSIFRPDSPPLFLVGKDLAHQASLKDPNLRHAVRNTWELKSLKVANAQDLRCLCRLSHALAKRARTRLAARGHVSAMRMALRTVAAGATGVDAVEGREPHEGRSVVSVGGGDTNPFFSQSVYRYSRVWRGYPVLRFTLTTSEVIIAMTLDPTRRRGAFSAEFFWEDNTAQQAMDRTGLISCYREPRRRDSIPLISKWLRWLDRPNLWRLRWCRGVTLQPAPAVHLLLAGLHRQGTQASCQVLRAIVEEACGAWNEYQYAPNLRVPLAVTRLGQEGENRPLLLQQPVAGRSFEQGTPIPCEVEPDVEASIAIIAGLSFREYAAEARAQHEKASSHLSLAGASRVLDLVVRLGLFDDTQVAVWGDASPDRGEPARAIRSTCRTTY